MNKKKSRKSRGIYWDREAAARKADVRSLQMQAREFEQKEAAQKRANEIRTLVKLCHPDKHGDSKEAEAITAKLLTMRKP